MEFYILFVVRRARPNDTDVGRIYKMYNNVILIETNDEMVLHGRKIGLQIVHNGCRNIYKSIKNIHKCACAQPVSKIECFINVVFGCQPNYGRKSCEQITSILSTLYFVCCRAFFKGN